MFDRSGNDMEPSYKTSEEAFQAFLALKGDLPKYDLSGQTEADTRARLITRLLTDVLDWQPEQINREEHAHPGYMDYVLLTNRRIAVVEAKRSGDVFHLPNDLSRVKNLRLAGVVRTVKNLQTHISQVFGYCSNNGIEYAVVTNGLQYVIFRAIRTDGIHIGQGRVIVFPSFDDIEQRFVEFWSLLARPNVENNSLVRAFQPDAAVLFQYKRLADQVHTYREKVSRNRLSRDLEPLLAEYMGEIAGVEQAPEKLKRLYVRSTALSEVLEAVGQKISLSLSATIKQSGRVIEPKATEELKKGLQQQVQSHVSLPVRSQDVLLLGRVGSGKTTFVTHFLTVDLVTLLKGHIVVQIDFRLLEKGGRISSFFYDTLHKVLTKNQRFTDLTSKQLRHIYTPEIRELSVGPLAVLERTNKKRYEEKIADFLMEQYKKPEIHYVRVLRYLAEKQGVRSFVFFDNVDQHDFDSQQEIFTFAHSVAAKCHAFAIVTMWEETFIRSKQKGALSAYQTPAYSVPPTSVVDIIVRRLEYMVDQIRSGGLARALIINRQNTQDVQDFLELVRVSLLHDKKRARFFLESIAMGNLRKAMDVFSSFLVSGHTDALKMLDTVRETRGYLIPLHEFIKSIGLGEYRFYYGDLSYVLNVFSISDESRPSHFTKLRLLEYLFHHRNRSTALGIGFIGIDFIRSDFQRIGTSEADLTESLKVLSRFLLVENDVYDADRTGHGYRITAAGRYYLRYLVNKFTYLDLVLQDTPIADNTAFEEMKDLLTSRELEDRFARVETFLTYLLAEEEREHSAVLSTSESIPLRQKMMPPIITDFHSDKDFIRSKRRRRRKGEPTPYISEDQEDSSGATAD